MPTNKNTISSKTNTNPSKVKLDLEQCERVADIIKKCKFKPSFCNRDFITLPIDKETKLRAYLYSVAICHQTHTLINQKLNLKGWDYIEYVFTNLAKDNSKLLKPDYLASLTVDELSNQLKSLFSDDGNPDNCTLDRLEERSKFLIETARVIKDEYKGEVNNLLNLSELKLLNKGKGLYEILEKIEPYSDPLRKKSTVFIKFIEEAGLAVIKDPENFIPIMDYHMQRVLLRLGCVEVLDINLQEKLRNKEKISSDVEVRNASVEAIKAISKIPGLNVANLNDFFWALGRSCCTEKTLCHDKKCCKKPCTFTLLVDLLSHNECIFQKICKGSSDEKYRKYWQPIVDTHYY